MEEFSKIEINETQPRLLFKVILMRHEETDYEAGGGHLTGGGVEKAVKTGENLKKDKFFSDENPILLFHSPLLRTEETLDAVAKGARVPAENKRKSTAMRGSKIANLEAFLRRKKELGSTQEAVAKDYHEGESHPEIIEPPEKSKERLYRAMEYLIRSIMKNVDESKNTSPQIFAVSHFEIITHLIDDVFGIENIGKYDSPSFGEQVKISAFQTENRDEVLLDIEFRNLRKKVIFNRKTRMIGQITKK